MATLQHPLICRNTKPPHEVKPQLEPGPYKETRPRPLLIRCRKSKSENAFKEKKKAHVNYDDGTHTVSVQISGLRKSDLPKRHRMRVETDRFQKDWSITEVVQNIIKLKHWQDIEGVLNRWAGRFSRKNFPFLIKVNIFNFSLVANAICFCILGQVVIGVLFKSLKGFGKSFICLFRLCAPIERQNKFEIF